MNAHNVLTASLRAKIAAAALVLLGLISIYQPLSAGRLRVSAENEVLVVLDRARCLADALPAGVQRYGSLIIRPGEDSGNQLQRLYLLRYLLAPSRVSAAPDAPWVIGYYADQASGLQDLQSQPDLSGRALTLVKDCANGVFLLKR